MKKLITFAILAAFVLGFAASAAAVDITAKGQFRFRATMADNGNFIAAKDYGTGKSPAYEDDFTANFRARAQFRFIASENLMGELYTEWYQQFGYSRWALTGDPSGTTATTNQNALGVKRAYLQWKIPGTEIINTAGIYPVSLPGMVAGNPVFNYDEGATFLINGPIVDPVSFVAGWARYIDVQSSNWNIGTNTKRDSKADALFLALPVKVDGFTFAPYGVYAMIGRNASKGAVTTAAIADGLVSSTPSAADLQSGNGSAWWGGFGFSMTYFDPIKVDLDFMYGAVQQKGSMNDRKGYFFDIAVGYTGLSFMKPSLFFAYSTGDDNNTSNGSEMMPYLAYGFQPGGYFFGGTKTGADLANQGQSKPMGFWAVGLALKDISFVEKLAHDVSIMYVKGTNSDSIVKNAAFDSTVFASPANYLTKKDSMWELALNTDYKIYENLSAALDLGWIIQDFDKNTWQNSAGGGANSLLGAGGKFTNAARAAFALIYSF